MKLHLPLFGKKKKEEFPEEFLAIDLGGKLLKAFLFKVEPACAESPLCGTVRLLAAKKEPRTDNAANDLREIIGELKSDFPDLPKTAVVGVSGPYASGFTTVVRSARVKDVNALVDQARALALRQAETEMQQSLGDPRLSLLELEAEVLETKEAEKMEVFLFTSFGERDYLKEAEALLRRAKLTLWGFSFLPFNLVDALSDENLNALIVDVGGAKTEISLVFGGELMDTKSFWWDFAQSSANPTLFLDLWLNATSDALGEFKEVKIFPRRILLTGGGASFPDLIERVGDFPWGRDHPFEAAPEAGIISKNVLEGVHAEGTGLDLPEDILPLALGRVALRVREEEEDREPEGGESKDLTIEEPVSAEVPEDGSEGGEPEVGESEVAEPGEQEEQEDGEDVMSNES